MSCNVVISLTDGVKVEIDVDVSIVSARVDDKLIEVDVSCIWASVTSISGVVNAVGIVDVVVVTLVLLVVSAFLLDIELGDVNNFVLGNSEVVMPTLALLVWVSELVVDVEVAIKDVGFGVTTTSFSRWKFSVVEVQVFKRAKSLPMVRFCNVVSFSMFSKRNSGFGDVLLCAESVDLVTLVRGVVEGELIVLKLLPTCFR